MMHNFAITFPQLRVGLEDVTGRRINDLLVGALFELWRMDSDFDTRKAVVHTHG